MYTIPHLKKKQYVLRIKVWNPQLVIPRKVKSICTILMFWRTNQFGPVFNGLLHLISVTMRTIQPHKMSDFLSSYFNIAWENSRNLATLPLISTRNDVLTTTHTIPYWWRISITTQTWVVIRMEFLRSFLRRKKKLENQSWGRKMSLFSTQANINWTLYVLSHAPANSGWRSDGQILNLKQHVHGVV